MHYSQILPFRPLPAILLQIPLARCHVHYKDSCWHYSDCLQLEMELTCLCSYDFTHSTTCSDKMSYKNCKTDTSFNQRIRSCSSRQSVSHFRDTIYMIMCALHFSYLYLLTNQEMGPLTALLSYPTFVPPTAMNSIKWRCTCTQTLELYGRTTFPAPFLRCATLIRSTTGVLCAHDDWMIGWSVKGPYSQPLAIWR